MDTKKNNRIEEILSSLDGSNRAAAPDFLYTRLKAKMLARHAGGEEDFNKTYSRSWKLRPVYIVSALLLVLAINVFVFLNSQNETTTADNNESVQQSIASEYSLNDINTVYDINQDK